MTEQSKTRIPAPLYAAAGAGDLAYEQLRRLPAVVTELREKATAGRDDLRQRAVATRSELRKRAAATFKAANETASELRGKAAANDLDMDHLREMARRNAHTVLTEAKAAQVRAIEVYHQLVARGERVVGSGVVEVADTVNADMETTEAAEVAATPADVAAIDDPAAEADEAKAEAEKAEAAKTPTKRTRPAARK